MTKTLVTFLLDRTGSMSAVKRDTIGAFNTYLEELKKGDGIDFTFVQFDSVSIDKICVREPIATVVPLNENTYQPRAWTPLIDAAYKTIKATEEALKDMPTDTKVVVCIQTDGEENASTEHTWEELNALIKEKTALNWQFNFMGVGLDAYNQGARMGIARGSTVAYDPTDTVSNLAAFAAAADNTVAYSTGMARNTAYSADQKLAAGDKFDTPGTTHGKAKVTSSKTPKRKPPIVEDFNL